MTRARKLWRRRSLSSSTRPAARNVSSPLSPGGPNQQRISGSSSTAQRASSGAADGRRDLAHPAGGELRVRRLVRDDAARSPAQHVRARLLEPLEHDRHGRVDEEERRHGVRPAREALAQQREAVLALAVVVALERDGRARQLLEEGVQRARVPELLLRDGGAGDGALERGRSDRRLRQPAAEEVLVVGEHDDEVGERRVDVRSLLAVVVIPVLSVLPAQHPDDVVVGDERELDQPLAVALQRLAARLLVCAAASSSSSCSGSS